MLGMDWLVEHHITLDCFNKLITFMIKEFLEILFKGSTCCVCHEGYETFKMWFRGFSVCLVGEPVKEKGIGEDWNS